MHSSSLIFFFFFLFFNADCFFAFWLLFPLILLFLLRPKIAYISKNWPKTPKNSSKRQFFKFFLEFRLSFLKNLHSSKVSVLFRNFMGIPRTIRTILHVFENTIFCMRWSNSEILDHRNNQLIRLKRNYFCFNNRLSIR